jgi:hypothetical protein
MAQARWAQAVIQAAVQAALLSAVFIAPGAQAQAQAATSQSRSAHTERTARDAAVADEASTAPPGRAGPAEQAGTPRDSATSATSDTSGTSGTSAPAPMLSYGPVLIPRGQQRPAAAPPDPARKPPAEVRDETDTLTHPAPAEQGQSTRKKSDQSSRQPRPAIRRHEAWQADTPMAPRPLHPADETAGTSSPVPVPVPTRAPQAIVPTSSAINSCQGGTCTTTSGATINLGTGNAGVSSSGRLCARTGSNVQCF